MAWPGLEDAVALVAERGQMALAFEPAFQAIEPAPPAAPVHAVDASQAVLVENGPMWIVAVRAAAVTWPGPLPRPKEPRMVACVAEEAQSVVEAWLAPHGLEAPRVDSADSLASVLAGILEFEATLACLKDAQPGDLLLVDGALFRRSRPDSLPNRMMARILESAGRVRVVGVAKRSKLADGGVPLVSAYGRLGEGRPGASFAPVPRRSGVCIARLHPRSPVAFRIDGADPGSLAELAFLARDAVYVGYPYPLAMAHNAVAITGSTAEEGRQDLLHHALQQGSGAAALLADFHDVLDRNVP